jgi:hypothetical protein
VRTGQFERIDNPSEPEIAFAFRTALEKAVPRLTREEAETVAKRLLHRLIQVYVDSAIARELTAGLNNMTVRPKQSTANPNSRRPFKVVIANHGEPLAAWELTEFLTLFGDVYALAADLPENQDSAALLSGPA